MKYHIFYIRNFLNSFKANCSLLLVPSKYPFTCPIDTHDWIFRYDVRVSNLDRNIPERWIRSSLGNTILMSLSQARLSKPSLKYLGIYSLSPNVNFNEYMNCDFLSRAWIRYQEI